MPLLTNAKGKIKMKLATFGTAILLTSALFGCEYNDSNKPFRIQSASTSVASWEPLPAVHSCEDKPFGEGVSPELNWTNMPEGTKSYAIVLKDISLIDHPDFSQFAHHWSVWNIPTSVNSLPEELPDGPLGEDFGDAQQINASPASTEIYFGPCPSWGNYCSDETPISDDNYSFIIYALPIEQAGIPAAGDGNYVADLEAYFESIAIDKAELAVTSDARPSDFPFCPE